MTKKDNRPAIIFPDFEAEMITEHLPPGVFSDFITVVHENYPTAIIIPVLNGLAGKNLTEARKQAKNLGLTPALSKKKGLLSALVTGYETAFEVTSGPIIRMDTAEHPPEKILDLVQISLAKKAMIIGDLDFSDGGLVSGTADEILHLDAFPKLYSKTTGGKLSISAAHGFQIFPDAKTCKKIFINARKVVQAVAKDIGPISWGFDGAMALGAIASGIPVRVVKIPASTIRHRPPQKVADQYLAAKTLCETAVKIFRLK
jgi:hypothetical protein